MTTELLDAVTALSGEVGELSTSVRGLEQQSVEVKTALNLTNSILQRIETSIGFLRRDVEHIQKCGCTVRCPPPASDEPDTAPCLPPLRAVGAQHD